MQCMCVRKGNQDGPNGFSLLSGMKALARLKHILKENATMGNCA